MTEQSEGYFLNASSRKGRKRELTEQSEGYFLNASSRRWRKRENSCGKEGGRWPMTRRKKWNKTQKFIEISEKRGIVSKIRCDYSLFLSILYKIRKEHFLDTKTML